MYRARPRIPTDSQIAGEKWPGNLLLSQPRATAVPGGHVRAGSAFHDPSVRSPQVRTRGTRHSPRSPRGGTWALAALRHGETPEARSKDPWIETGILQGCFYGKRVLFVMKNCSVGVLCIPGKFTTNRVEQTVDTSSPHLPHQLKAGASVTAGSRGRPRRPRAGPAG